MTTIPCDNDDQFFFRKSEKMKRKNIIFALFLTPFKFL